MFAGEDPAAHERVAAGIRRWQDDLNQALEPHLGAPLLWDEDQEQGWSMELPAVAHRALLLLAAHAQKTEHPWPDEVPHGVDTDPAWQEISDGDFARCHYPQVVIPRLWVPGDFALTMKHALPDGEDVVLGSLDGLAMQLRVLNNNTLQMSSEAVEGHVPGVEATLETTREFIPQAACGLAALLKASEMAQTLRVPVRLLQSN